MFKGTLRGRKYLMNSISKMAMGAALLVCTCVMGLSITGCSWMFRRGGGGGGGSSDSSDGYSGSVVFTNNVGEAVCAVELFGSDSVAQHMERLENGASINLTSDVDSPQLFVKACDGDRFLYADNINLTGEQYSFDSASPQTFQERFDYLRRLNRMNTNPTMQEPAIQSQMLQQIQQVAQSRNWIDTPSVVLISSDAWSVLRNNLTGIITGRRIAGTAGHRFNDGHCTIQIHTWHQNYIGGNFVDLRYEGSAGPINAGCVMVDWMEQRAGGGGGSASSAASNNGGGAGAQCSNTCNSANDGECDDGGPGAQYSVCAFGTDCNDCGPRSGGASQQPASSGQCSNTCNSAHDGECDDGGPGAQYSVCALGTDCGDCGPR